MKRLLIISDTSMYVCGDGRCKAFGPVVREMPTLSQFFDEIIWIGYLDKTNYGDYFMLDVPSNVKLIPLKMVGGKSLLNKATVVLALPSILYAIIKELRLVHHIHTRGPSVPALLAIGLSFIFKSKVWWHKYAGNWNEITPPLSYKTQRFLLKKLKSTNVTINGFWPNQPKHCISFENPCLSEQQLKMGRHWIHQRKFKPPFNFIFIGRLEDAKGVGLIIEVIRKIDKSLVNAVKIIGDGPKRSEYENRTKDLNYITFLGGLNNDNIHEELKQSDFLLLPSASEGFPKVIAEAACYGVVPIVSDVGSISHYINAYNGFVCDSKYLLKSFNMQLNSALNTKSIQLKQKSIQVSTVAQLFTFNAYFDKLQKYIFKK